MQTEFLSSHTESDVEQFFILPLLTSKQFLAIPEISVRTKSSLATFEIGKGNNKKKYVPDYMIFYDGIPTLVVEAKNPNETLDRAIEEAQLYALEINKNYDSGINPCEWVFASNGCELWLAKWDDATPKLKVRSDLLTVGATNLQQLIEYIGWDAIIHRSTKIQKQLTPRDWARPSEHLGENRVNLAKAGHNSLYADLEPILRRYFDPKDSEYESKIIEKAYVSTEETTKYTRVFEDFLRTRIIPLGEDRISSEIHTNKKSSDNFTKRISQISDKNKPFMQLIIGGVGSGKTTFLKRYFNHLVPEKLKNHVVYCRIDFNTAPDDVSELEDWVCRYFIDQTREKYGHLVDLSSKDGLLSVFSKEIKDNSGAYEFLKSSSESEYYKRVGEDLLSWMEKPKVFAKALARSLGGDRNRTLVVAFDNVDRRERDVQLKIFQVGQWFMNATKSICLMTLRDETFEAYKDEKPLDAFLKTGNFYIRPPRFVDMVNKRLRLAIEEISSYSPTINSYEIDGIGKITYPSTAVGQYLTSIFIDLFKKRRNITVILEGLSGRNSRKSLEMFISSLTSAHFETKDFTQSILTMGEYKIQESTLLRALMRTTYLYFSPSHGFVRNIYDFPINSIEPNHFLKSEILNFLIKNRKKPGDTRFEGYFTVGKIQNIMSTLGYNREDTMLNIDELISDELIMAERQTKAAVANTTAVRVRPSGYVHMKILSSRLDYFSACGLITPISNAKAAQTIGEKWHINDPHTDARHRAKSEAAYTFLLYLKDSLQNSQTSGVGFSDAEKPGSFLIASAEDGINFTHGTSLGEEGNTDEFMRLFE